MPKAQTYTAYGVTKSIPEWAKQTGLTHQAIRHRIRAGWSMEDALTAQRQTPSSTNQHLIGAATYAQMQFQKQMRKTFRRLVQQTELQMKDLNQRLLRALVSHIDPQALAAALHEPGVAQNFAKKPSDRSSPTTPDLL